MTFNEEAGKKLIPKVYRFADVVIDLRRRQVERDGRKLKVTDKGFDLLSFMVVETWKKPSRQFTNAEIIANVWPNEPATSAGTINRHTANIRQELKCDCIRGIRGSHVLVGSVEDATPPEPEFLIANRLIVGCTTSAVFTLLITLITRTILGALGLTLTEPRFSLNGAGLAAILGWFQGMVGALAWSLPISFGLLRQWFVVDAFNSWRKRAPHLNAAGLGTIYGFLGGLLADLGLIFAQRPETLTSAGWILSPHDSRWTAFSVTGFAYVELALGAVIGCTCGLSVIKIVQQPWWQSFLTGYGKLENLEGTTYVIKKLLSKALQSGSVLVCIPMMSTALASYVLLSKHSPQIQLLRCLGEGLSIATSGIGLVAGLLFGLFSLTKGFEITGEKKCSLSPIQLDPKGPTSHSSP